MPWKTRFDDPIVLNGRRKLQTLQDAADYIMQLPASEQDDPHWQVAIETLILAAEAGGGWLMFARIGMLRALNESRGQRTDRRSS